MSNSLGTLFRITSFGESHGRCIGVVIDGCPSGLHLDLDSVQYEMDRRRPGQSQISTKRLENDRVEILSGIYEGITTGAPICMVVWNNDVDSSSYENLRWIPRPGHADLTAHLRYGGYNDPRGGGRFSGRITAGFVMAGSVAQQLLDEVLGVEIVAFTSSIGGLEVPATTIENIRSLSESNPVRCPHGLTAEKMRKVIESMRMEGDSVGGSVDCLVINLPAGVGAPVFDTLEGDIAKALFAIPAVKAVEFGAGVGFSKMKGSDANDPITIDNCKVTTKSNVQGGIAGGISNGMPIKVRVTIKPTPSISKMQRTIDLRKMVETEINVGGRHDPCIVPRAVPVVEAMVAIVLTDHALMSGLVPRVIEVKK